MRLFWAGHGLFALSILTGSVVGAAAAPEVALTLATGALFGAGCVGMSFATFPLGPDRSSRTWAEPFAGLSLQLPAYADRVPLVVLEIVGLGVCGLCAIIGAVPGALIAGTAASLAVGLRLAMLAGPEVEVRIGLHRLSIRRGSRTVALVWDEVLCAVADPIGDGDAELVVAAASGWWRTGVRAPCDTVTGLIRAIDQRLTAVGTTGFGTPLPADLVALQTLMDRAA